MSRLSNITSSFRYNSIMNIAILLKIKSQCKSASPVHLWKIETCILHSIFMWNKKVIIFKNWITCCDIMSHRKIIWSKSIIHNIIMIQRVRNWMIPHIYPRDWCNTNWSSIYCKLPIITSPKLLSYSSIWF